MPVYGPPTDSKVSKTSLPKNPVDYGAVGDGVANDYAALVATLAATPVGGIIDLGGLTYAVGTSWQITKQVEVRNGGLTSAGCATALLNAAGNIVRNVTFTRTTTTLGADAGFGVLGQAPFRSIDCNYASAAGLPLRLQHALCNGSIIRGGTITPTLQYRDTFGLYAAPGATGNIGITVDGVTFLGNDSTSIGGVAIYDASRCVVRNCNVSGMVTLPDVPFTSGWTLVIGNIYSHTDRTDGVTRSVLIAGTEYTEQTATPTVPASNEWGISGGLLYINLAGTDPNTVTVTSRVVSGYGILFYNTTTGSTDFSDNRVENNIVRDVDGFALYYQMGGAAGTEAKRNSTNGNKFYNTCRKGQQSNKLPFAAFGVIGGFDSSFNNDLIDTVGVVTTYPAPGFRVNPLAGGLSSGVVTGMQMQRATKSGITVPSGQWQFIGCRSLNNLNHGFEFWNSQSGDVDDATFASCEAAYNGVHGLCADGSVAAGGTYRANIIGGHYHHNTTRNIALKSAKDCSVIGATLGNPGSGQYNIQIDTNNARVVIDDNRIIQGNGINVAAGNVDIAIGVNHVVTGWTSFNLAVPVRVGGTLGVGATFAGNATPEGVVTAAVGAQYRRLDGGGGTTIYTKETGSGNTGWTAQAPSVAPSFVPADHGLTGWSFDPILIGAAVGPTAGVARTTRARVHVDGAITSVKYWMGAVGTSLANCYIAVYDLTGVQLGVTADQSTGWQTGTGIKTSTLASPTASQLAGTEVIVAFLVGTGTPPTFGMSAATTGSAINANLTASATGLRAGTYSSGLTALPSPLVLATQASASQAMWIGFA